MSLKKGLPAALVILGVAYLANCFAPLRLGGDTVRYFSMMENMRGVWPPNLPSVQDSLPYGYVFFLRLLSGLHLLYPASIVLLQAGYLCGSLYFIKRLFGSAVNILVLTFFVLTSWLTIKLVVVPLSETQYLFFSLGALFQFQQFRSTAKPKYGLYTLLFCAAGILTRTAGVALFAALSLTFLYDNRRWLKTRSRVILFLSTAALPGLFWTLLMTSSYFADVRDQFGRSPVHYVATCFAAHVTDWGEVFINVPFSKLSGYIHTPLLAVGYKIVGLISLIAFLYIVIAKTKLAAVHVRIYLLLYICMILNWPFFDGRFWFPVLPLIIAILLQLRQKGMAIAFYKAVFCVAGVLGISYYLYLSFDQDALTVKHDAGRWRTEYRAYFSGTGDTSGVDQKAFYILKEYGGAR